MSENAVVISNVDFSYNEYNIYKDLSLTIPKEQITFIMGNNGCGKTTLLKLMINSLTPQKGKIIVGGNDVSSLSVRSFAKLVSYVPQTLQLNSDFLVKDYLVLGRSPYIHWGGSPTNMDYQIVESCAEKLGLTDLLEKDFNKLSGGQKQAVAITRALVQDTPIIVMDEPMSALDIGKQTEVMLLLLQLRSIGKTIILTSHNPNHAFHLESDVCLIHNGKVLGNGKPEQVLTPGNVSAVYGDNVRISECDRTRNLVFDLH